MKLKAAKEAMTVADPRRFVVSLDSASTTSINSYAASIAKNLSRTTQTSGAANPAEAMKAYFKTQGIDSSSMSYEVVTTSASESGGDATYFLLHNVNGDWTVVDSGSSLTAAKMKSDGAPSDLKAVP